jgi:ribonuclease HI
MSNLRIKRRNKLRAGLRVERLKAGAFTARERAKNVVRIYTDGACEPNPGIGGCAAIIIYPNGYILQRTSHHGATTNNRMEIQGAIIGLSELSGNQTVWLYSDSQYLVNTMVYKWNKIRKNADLWQQLDRLRDQHHVTFKWIRGHNGDKFNEMCDVLADQARKDDTQRM